MARPNPRFVAILALLLIALVAIVAAPPLARRYVEKRLRAEAAARGYEATWSRLALSFPAATLERLRVTNAAGDTVAAVDTLEVRLRTGPLLRLQVQPAYARIAAATLHAGGTRQDEEVDPDEAPPEGAPVTDDGPRPADSGVRGAADALIRLLLVPARRLPELDLRDVTVAAGASDGDPTEHGVRALHLEHLRLRHLEGGPRGARSTIEAAGAARLERDVPFVFDMTYDRRDRVSGHARFGIPDAERRALEPLVITVDGRFVQQRRRGAVAIDSVLVTFGEIPVRVSGRMEREGPRIRLDMAADSLTGPLWRRSVPRPVLGPLLELEIGGAWDQRLAFDLDLVEPDSVRFEADVIPRGMRLERTGALNVFGLDEPFVARIHLPNHTVERDLSARNPHFLPLAAIDSNLVHAVVTNEDGAFFRHGGFNMEAVRDAIAENARAGRFRRGAGTITMQLARNLYLGHERTLSRKWQEVALAWILEHLTAVAKERLLEIYLNVIEWGPGVHGADEAARFYFGHGAGEATIDEALFLATVIPAPSRWKWRLEKDGTLRAGTRAQMHFIGRRMIDKGWLRPEALPPRDSLRIELLGPARDLMLPEIAMVDDPRFEAVAGDTSGVGAPADSAADSARTGG